MVEEIWRPIKGYEGLYQVSSLGRVRSLNYRQTGQVRVLKAEKNRWGYLFVNLCKNKKPKSCIVHRLVAIAFIPNPLNLPQINHINEDKTDNRVENLEWCDCRYNINYGTRIQRQAEKLSKQVAQYNLGDVLVAIYPSAREAARQTGFDNSSICKCCLGKLNQAYGYVWKYV